LVLLWAQHPKADAAVLAVKWGHEMGRAIGADAVSKELERLSLRAAAGPARKTAKTK
jgi:hypothetical protein